MRSGHRYRRRVLKLTELPRLRAARPGKRLRRFGALGSPSRWRLRRLLFGRIIERVGRVASDRMAGAGGFTPESPIWRISREWALMMGGGRALLLQAAHPLALAGVIEHSDYERDVWGRLRSTMTYVWGVVYGSEEEAERLGRRVRAIHKTVHGELPRAMGPFPAGTPYSAEDPELLLWVHSTLVDTALLMYRTYVGPLSTDEMEGFWQDHRKLVAFIGVPEHEIPETYADFRAYWRGMIDSDVICVTPEALELARVTVMRPPLPLVLRPAWEAVNFVSAGFLPAKLRTDYGFSWTPAHRALLAGSAQYVRRVIVPLLPDLARALPAARRAERDALAA